MADAKISELPSATPQSGDQFPFVRGGVTSRANFFETGTWTPTLTFATPGNLSVAYTNQLGRYIRIGNLVVVSLRIDTSSFTHSTASGALQITGLPFTALSATAMSWQAGGRWRGVTKANYTDMSFNVATNTTAITVRACGSGQADANVDAANMPSAGAVVLRTTLAYQV
jgi:hypothetical protein